MLKIKGALSSTLVVFFVTVTMLSANYSQAYAGGESNPTYCDPMSGYWTLSEELIKDVDSRTTISNITGAALEVSTAQPYGATQAELVSCANYFGKVAQEKISNPDVVAAIQAVGANCKTVDPEVCEGFQQLDGTVSSNPLALREYFKSKGDRYFTTKTSFIGSILTAQDILQTTPPPLNLAYYWNRSVDKVPFVGKTFARVNYTDYKGPESFLVLVYDMTLLTRTLAYGVLAIALAITGIMIMTRKKISAQASVTVQYALPRIIQAIVLITFVYPIGAALASLAWSAAYGADSMIVSLATLLPPDSLVRAALQAQQTIGSVGYAAISTTYSAGLGKFGGFWKMANVMQTISAFLANLIAFIALLLVEVKMFTTYLKLLLGVIFAPFELALSAIPGNEAMASGWLKKVLSGTLSMMALGVGLQLTQVFAWGLSLTFWLENAGIVLTIPFINVFISAAVLIYGYNLTRKLPEKIEAMIIGKK